ncbi:MAG TPA: ankyrin repeat domain-containing protein [Pyrinomonadaceae bacterium]|jgi:ankyrin repeat protein|nr:ankyrin repeat domain-containing protein [Pyrinomonadaceae bacterium]
MPKNNLRLLALCLMIGVLSSCKPASQPGANNGPGAAANTAPATRSTEEIALLDAAIKGDNETVKSLLDQGVNPNTKDGDGRTPMTEAAYFGHIEIVKMLIFKGGDMWAKKNDGETPVTMAAGHPDIVKLMKLSTDLVDAARAGDNKAIVALLDKGAYVNAKDVDGRSGLTEAAWENHVDTVKLLLEKGANANTKKNDGVTPLSIATGRGHKEIEELLKKAGAK